MTPNSLPLLLLLLSSALQAAPVIPEIANRHQLSGYAANKEPEPPASLYGPGEFEFVRRDLLDPAVDDMKKAMAAAFWSTQLTNAYYNPRPEFWAAVDMTADLLDKVFAQPPSPARRHTISLLYGNLVAQVRGAVIDTPKDRQWAPHYKRVHAFVARGLADQDPLLAEHFERFVPLPKTPNDKAEKAAARKVHQALIAANPADKKQLDDIWALCERLEAAQRKQRDDVAAKVKAKNFGPKLERRLLRYSAETYAYRFHTIWTAQYLLVLEESLGPAEAKKFGIVVQPVTNGWPQL